MQLSFRRHGMQGDESGQVCHNVFVSCQDEYQALLCCTWCRQENFCAECIFARAIQRSCAHMLNNQDQIVWARMRNRQYFSPKKVTVMFPKGNEETTYFEYTGRETLLMYNDSPQRNKMSGKVKRKMKQHRPWAECNKMFLNYSRLSPSLRYHFKGVPDLPYMQASNPSHMLYICAGLLWELLACSSPSILSL